MKIFSSYKKKKMEIEQWKLKRLISTLNELEGAGTSMISLLIPPSTDSYGSISRVVKMLTDEMGTAVNIKSRVNRLSVQSAITSAIQKLKTYSCVPPNGLVLYYGLIPSNVGDKKIAMAFSPYKPITTSLYMCDSKFHTEGLLPLLVCEDVYGFIIVDGGGAYFYTLQGDIKVSLKKYEVDLPKKHSKGGQSSQRFGRIRQEKRQNYITKVGEIATQVFITNNLPNVKGIILGGSAEFKHTLLQFLDPRLTNIILGIVDVSYGGDNGFMQAIELSSGIIKNSRFIKEKKLIESFMAEIAKNTGKFCYGIRDVMYALEEGAIETLIVWDELPLKRYVLQNGDIKYTEQKEYEDVSLFVDWIAVNYTNYGCALEIISNSSGEGMQFCMGFGGIGAIMRFPLSFDVVEEEQENLVDDITFDADFL